MTRRRAVAPGVERLLVLRGGGQVIDVSIRNLVIFSVSWAFIHSALASDGAKRLARRWFGPKAERWYRLAYVVWSAFSLIPIFPLVYGQPYRTLYVVPSPWRWLMVAVEVLAVVGIAAITAQLRFVRVVGWAQLRGTAGSGTPTLQTTGLFRYVRHPQYVCSLVLIWMSPFMITTLLAAFIVATLYFVIGSFLEERKLVRLYGDAYREYQRRVPRFVPVLGRVFLPRRGKEEARHPQA